MANTLLNVEHSLMQARWVMPSVEQDLVERIARQHDLPEIIARLLVSREIPTDEVESFLYPTLKDHFPDPYSLVGMADLAEDLSDAIMHQRKIGVFGDFDVDGATSTAILVRFFRHLGIEIPFYIPDRLKEGYGPNIDALKTLKEQGAEIVIMVDCGITAFDVVAQGRELGLELVILDHHEAEDKLPEAHHVIDPKRDDDSSGLDMLAACGVTFLTCVAVNGKLREKGYYQKNGLAEAPLKNWLDIVALGTVCDMVPLTGANRLLVRSGFAQMAHFRNPGIRALCDVAKVTGVPAPYHAGFVLGPRINAGSRVHQADLGARLLSTDHPEEARNIAFTLEDCNAKRKEIERAMIDHAVNMIEDQRLQDHPVIIVGDRDWHPGLSGLVAGRLKERYGKPCCVITYAVNEKGELIGRGSGRSVSGVNMGAAFIDARNEGLVINGGGHAMAGGFSLLPENLDAFKAYLADHIDKQASGLASVSDTTIDGILSVRGVTPDLVNLIHDNFGPFGSDHPEPLFVLPQVRLQLVDVVGSDHVRVQFNDWEGGPRMKGIAFRAADTAVGQTLLKEGRDQPFHLAGHLKINDWQGRQSAEMHLYDAAPSLENHLDKLAS